MKHDNLNRLVGVCPTSSTVCIVSINCRYGSLRDTLIMPDRSYDWGFKTQFALDIAKVSLFRGKRRNIAYRLQI